VGKELKLCYFYNKQFDKIVENFMKRIFFLIIFLSYASYAFGQFIDTKWKVMDFLGEAWFADTKNIIGKTQDFYKGWSEGVFYSCDYAGQSATYNSYTRDEFLKNKEFSLFKKFKVNFIDEEIFVHRITCNGKKGFDRKDPELTREMGSRGTVKDCRDMIEKLYKGDDATKDTQSQ